MAKRLIRLTMACTLTMGGLAFAQLPASAVPLNLSQKFLLKSLAVADVADCATMVYGGTPGLALRTCDGSPQQRFTWDAATGYIRVVDTNDCLGGNAVMTTQIARTSCAPEDPINPAVAWLNQPTSLHVTAMGGIVCMAERARYKIATLAPCDGLDLKQNWEAIPFF